MKFGSGIRISRLVYTFVCLVQLFFPFVFYDIGSFNIFLVFFLDLAFRSMIHVSLFFFFFCLVACRCLLLVGYRVDQRTSFIYLCSPVLRLRVYNIIKYLLYHTSSRETQVAVTSAACEYLLVT